ncbi:MAG: M23 family metallopeptidase, partial [Syntrophales bacterium]|nr:M23 family metallopeptidase [Syntrophales bacterium]
NIKIYAKDMGGNETISSIPSQILKKKFRSDKMPLSENFLQQKMPEFIPYNPELRGKPLIDLFVWVNTMLREDNFKTIQAVCQKSEARQLWQGTFLRMKNASPMAMYGDSRTYVYNGKTVGTSIHMGVDLASTTNAPIEASNSGIVSFAGPLGIYGNAVMIDHGFGVFTLYAHMANILVKAGQNVNMGDTIGKSGLSGLAGGDHLHFSVIVGGRFVNPTEWWDAHWIADNISKKMAISF